ncbi:unnamed protein product [Effrenium voratum]|nr:unnamed protein product [Effrenium voratum]
MLEGDGSDSLLGCVDFLDFPELGAYLACSQHLLQHAKVAWDGRSWRMRSLEGRLPSHVRWPKEALSGTRRACAVWRLGCGVRLYEQKRFKEAEDELRALLSILPHPFVMCRLADTLYGRAVSLTAGTVAASRAERSSQSSASAGNWQSEPEEAEAPEPEEAPEGEVEEEEEEEVEPEAPVPAWARSPMSPVRVEHVSSESSMEPLRLRENAVARWQSRREAEADPATEERTSSTVTVSASETPQTPQQPWNNWTPPLEVDEGTEPTQDTVAADEQDTLLARATSYNEGEEDVPDEVFRHSPIEEAEESAPKIEALRERLLSEAKDLYEQAYRECPQCSYAVNGLTLFVNMRTEKIELLERAIKLDDENPYALANLGAELFGQDDLRALQLLEKALQINPRLFYARLCKSKVLLRLGNLPAAVEAVF